MTAPSIQFDTAFPALTDHPPLRWQRRLFDQLRSGQIPGVCNLPTGLGLLACLQAEEKPDDLVAYLIMCHHSKVRVLRDPGDKHDPGGSLPTVEEIEAQLGRVDEV